MTPEEPSPLTRLAQLGGAAIGAPIGFYVGAMLLIPAVGAAVVGAAVKRFAGARAQCLLGAIAVQGGQAAWFVFGMLLTGQVAAVAPDVALLGVGLGWLLVRPGFAPVVLLALYHVVSTALHVTQLLQVDVGTVAHKALVTHGALRVGAVVLLVMGARRLRGEDLAAEAELAAVASSSPEGADAAEPNR